MEEGYILLHKSRNMFNSLNSCNISTNRKFNLQNSTIIVFIHDKHRNIEACIIYPFNRIFQILMFYIILFLKQKWCSKILTSIKNGLFFWIFEIVKNFSNCKTIFIIKGFQTIVFIFIVISTTFQPICPWAFFRCLSNSGTFTEFRTTSFIESTGVVCSESISHNHVKYSCIVNRLQSGLNLKPPDDCLLRSLGNQCL